MAEDASPERARRPEDDRREGVEAHRRELEECERGERECVLRKPVAPRESGRRKRLIVALAAVVVLLGLVAVPVVLAIVRSASDAARAGVEGAAETRDSLKRIEGHLQRDEARELAP